MSHDLIGIIQQMGTLPKLVVVVLVAMSLYSLYVAGERWLTYRRIAKQTHDFAVLVTELMREGKLKEALARCADRQFSESYLARLVNMSLTELESIRGKTVKLNPSESIERALDRARLAEVLTLRKGLSSLATVASVAPFVGLFGTVVGIITAFRAVSVASAGGVATLSTGIYEALVTTALGIFVAIPALWAYNYLVDSVESFEIQMESSSVELLDFCMKQLSVRGGGTSHG